MTARAGRGGSILLSVAVKPACKVEGIARCADGSGALEVRTSGRAQDGEANAAVIQALAGALGVPKSSLAIVKGATERNKVLALTSAAMTLAAVQARVDALPLQ